MRSHTGRRLPSRSLHSAGRELEGQTQWVLSGPAPARKYDLGPCEEDRESETACRTMIFSQFPLGQQTDWRTNLLICHLVFGQYISVGEGKLVHVDLDTSVSSMALLIHEKDLPCSPIRWPSCSSQRPRKTLFSGRSETKVKRLVKSAMVSACAHCERAVHYERGVCKLKGKGSVGNISKG